MVKRIFAVFILSFALQVISVSAQVRSLAEMKPGEKFVSAEGGFEVALPSNPAIGKDTGTGTMLTWVVKEGVIIINYWDRGLDGVTDLPKGTAREALVEEFVNQYKKGVSTVENVTTGDNKPSKLAGLSVTFFPTSYGKRSGLSSVYVEDHRSIMFLVIPLEEVPNSHDRMSEALETFKLIPKRK